MFALIRLGVPLSVCLTFGALISPTDPIAVMGLLKELRAPRDLEAQIAGESLFNDGSVSSCSLLVSLAGLSAEDANTLVARRTAGVFCAGGGGGVALGLGLG